MSNAMPLPPDAKQRRRVANDLGTNFLVEAGAGSGKTTLLVARMLALVSTGRVRVDQIAAVTFTRKAAAQLRERFQNRLEEALRAEADPVAKERLAAALASLDRCSIGTVHAFCGRLLRERAIEAGVDPSFTEIEGVQERSLEEAAWAGYLERQRHSGGAPLAELAALGVEPADLKGLYRMLAAAPDVTPYTEERQPPDLSAARTALAAFLAEVRRRLPAAPHPDGWDKLQEVLRRALRLARLTDLEQDAALIRLLSELDRKGEITQKRWPTPAEAKEALARFEQFQAESVAPTLKVWREYLHPKLISFVLPAVCYYAEQRRAASVMNYQDLLIEATALLRSHPHVRRYFAERYPVILIDEFQDTDPVQAELAMLLAGEEVGERDWRKAAPRPGALFVVGDPRQSIYRFRRADITVYQQFKQLLVNAGGEVLTLTANFRSVKAIGEWVNPAFARILPAEATEYQAPFGLLEAMQENPAGEVLHGVYRITHPKVFRHTPAEIARLDAERIARFIAWSCSGAQPLSPGAFMILTATRGRLSTYARALEAYGIPYAINGGKGFGEGEEIPQLITLLRSLADPSDAIALLGALRGLYFGLPDSLIYRFKKAGGTLSYLNPQPEGLPGEVAPVLEALERLREFWLRTRRLPLAAAVEQIIADLGIIPHLLSGEMGQSRAGNLLKVLELLRASSAAGLAGALAELESLLEDGEVEEGELSPAGGNAVRLMNLHRAKGLEAEIVFLADPAPGREHDPTAHVRRGEGESVGHYLVEADSGYARERLAQPPDWERWEAEERLFEAAEDDRLRYVAATRARLALVVSTYPEKETGAWAHLVEFLAGVPELPSGQAGLVERAVVEPDVAGLQAALEAVGSARAAAAQAAYALAPVTEWVRGASGAPAPWRSESLDGFSWGTAVHRYFEGLLLGRSGPAVAAWVLRSVGRPPEEAERLVRTGEEWLATSLYVRAMAAPERYAEVPVCGARGGAVVSGVVDLAFREEGGWVLVDYKTDVFEPEEAERFVRYYAPQLQAYARLWEDATGELVRGMYLYFTHQRFTVTV